MKTATGKLSIFSLLMAVASETAFGDVSASLAINLANSAQPGGRWSSGGLSPPAKAVSIASDTDSHTISVDLVCS